MLENREHATTPEDPTLLTVEPADTRDGTGRAEVCEPDGVLACPPHSSTVDRGAIRAVSGRTPEHAPSPFPLGAPPPVRYGGLVLTSPWTADGTGPRVAHRRPDGTRLSITEQHGRPVAR